MLTFSAFPGLALCLRGATEAPDERFWSERLLSRQVALTAEAEPRETVPGHSRALGPAHSPAPPTAPPGRQPVTRAPSAARSRYDTPPPAQCLPIEPSPDPRVGVESPEGPRGATPGQEEAHTLQDQRKMPLYLT